MQPTSIPLSLSTFLLADSFNHRKKKLVICSVTQDTGTSPVGTAGMANPVRWDPALARSLGALLPAIDVVEE
jgi:hypothetical protein